MADEQQELYHVTLMRTLWENMYSGTVFDALDHYVARIRLVLGVPLDRASFPKTRRKHSLSLPYLWRILSLLRKM